MSPNAPESHNPAEQSLDLETVLGVPGSTPVEAGTLKPEEQLLLALADGRAPVSEIVRLSGMPGSVSMRVLRSLVERGHLRPVGRAAVPPPPKGATSNDGRSRLTQDLTDFVGRLAETRAQQAALGKGASDIWPERRKATPDPRATLLGIETVAPRRSATPASAPAATPANRRTEVLRPGGTATAGVIERAGGPDPALDSPTRIGAYEVVSRMAQGGMGSIYLCRREGLRRFQRLYALKVIRQHASEADSAALSFLREARVSSLLSHPNILAIVDVGHFQQQPFLLMDYVEGTSLAHLLVEGTRCPPRLIVPVLIDVLRGLQAAHDLQDGGRDLGLVHCDLSPDNILVGTDGVGRVADFGSARFTALGEDDRARGILGKPAYMAPEQLKGEPVDARSDLFSLGVVLWTALTGRKLFVEQSYEQTVMNVLRRPVMPPSSYGGPRGLDELCVKALARNPAARFQTAEEMATALYRFAMEEGMLPGGAAVGAWVRQSMGEVLSERRQRLQDRGNGDSDPVIVAAEGFEAEDSAALAAGAAPTVALMQAAPVPPPLPAKTMFLRVSSGELAAVMGPVGRWWTALLARFKGALTGSQKEDPKRDQDEGKKDD